MRSMRIRYDEHGRSVRRLGVLQIVLIVLALLVLLWLVAYFAFNVGGTVPGSGEGDPLNGP